MAIDLERTKENSVDTDDIEPPKKKEEIKDLEVMSIEALSEYISNLEREIERVQMEISLKTEAKNSAESVFVS